MSIQSTINQQLIYYNGYHVLFKLFWLQNSLENNPLLFKWSNVQNSLNKFSQDYWLGKLGGLISSAIGFYTKIILSIWRDFQWCCLSWRNWLEYVWLGFKINLGSWSICIMEFSVTVIFLGVLKFCEFSSLVMSLSTLFVVVVFDSGERKIIAIIEAPRLLVISFCCEDTKHGGTTNVLLIYG